jgi:hypothetical protein
MVHAIIEPIFYKISMVFTNVTFPSVLKIVYVINADGKIQRILKGEVSLYH